MEVSPGIKRYEIALIVHSLVADLRLEAKTPRRELFASTKKHAGEKIFIFLDIVLFR
jgi:hypothetical protein